VKAKFQFHIAISLLLVYVLNFGTAIHDVLVDSFSESTFKTQTADKQSKDDSSRFYAYQDLEILGHNPIDSNVPNVFTERFASYNTILTLDASQTARDNQYFKARQFIIPSYNTQTCIFPFHDFI